MSLYHHAKEQKRRTTEALARYVAKRKADDNATPKYRPSFKVGQWWATNAGDVVRIDEVSWLSVRGTRWGTVHGQLTCFGPTLYGPQGHYIRADYADDNDLAFQLAKPEWAEELELVQ